MNRAELKFRFWDGYKFLSPTEVDEFCQTYGFYRLFEFHKVNQFIGMNDKNDVQLYEGDIVKRISKRVNYNSGEVIGGGFEIFYLVEFFEYKPCLKILHSNDDFTNNHRKGNREKQLDVFLKNAEIVGNFFQTPKLLKEGWE